MLIRKIIITLPLLLVINLYGNTDSASFYLGKGIELYNNGNIEISEKYFKKAIEFSKDANYRNEALIYLGMVSIKFGKYDNAINLLMKADSSVSDKISIYSNLAISYKKKGDYEKALLNNSNALNFAVNKEVKALITNNMANIYYAKNEFELALKYYKESLNLKKEVASKAVYSTYQNIALCYTKLDSVIQVNFFLKKAINEIIKNYGKRHNNLIQAYLNYGEFLLPKNPEKTKFLFNEAYNIALSTYGDKHPETAKSLASTGDYYRFKKDYKQALGYYQRALIANSKGFDNLDIGTNPQPAHAISELEQLDFLKSKASTLAEYSHNNKEAEDKLNISLETYEIAIDLLFYIQNTFMDESKRELIARNKDIFYKASGVALELGDNMKAYGFIEQSKASTLLAELANQDAIKFSGIPETLAEEEKELKRLLFYHKAQGNNDTVLYYQQKYDVLVAHLEKSFPKYYNLKYAKKRFNPQKHLDTNQVLLQFAVADSSATIFLLTHDSIKTHRFRTDSVFYDMAGMFLNCLRNYDETKNYKEQHDHYTASAYYLYTKLIEPLNIPKKKSLIIIPDGVISFIPFEAFLTKDAGDIPNYFSLPYLLYNHPVSYAYSARWLFDEYIGNPKGNVGSFAMDYLEKDSLSAIFYGIPQAKKIKREFGGRNYFNKECTSDNFIQHAGGYNILFLSLHGIINNEDGMKSYLPLFDRDLYTWEIYGMKLNARLAYLSACNTGDGEIDSGEGIMSMARAFAYAGCPTLISSLAAEYDNTPELTDCLFTLIREGKPIDYALQQAKIKHVEGLHMAHPRIWANKIVMGKTTPIKKQPTYPWLFLAGGIIFLFLLFLKINRKIF